MKASGKNKRLEKRLAYVPVILLLSAMLAVGTMTVLLPKAQTSAFENRALADFPWLNAADVLYGGSADSM